MKTVTLNQYLEQLADLPPNLSSQRQRAQMARAAVAQCLAQGGYLSRTRDSLPPLMCPSRATHAQLQQWWLDFDGWLQSISRREKRCLDREIVPAEPQGPGPCPSCVATIPRVASRKNRKALCLV